MADTRILAPPYCGFGHHGEGPPPLGAVLVCMADTITLATGAFRFGLLRAPWAVPCLLTTTATSDPDVLTAIHELPGHVCFVRDPLDDGSLPSRIVGAVRGRSIPSEGRLTDYVIQRTGGVALRQELARAFALPSEKSGPRVPERTLRDRLRRFGPLTASCWRSVGTLARLGARINDERVEILAWRAGVEARTLRNWTQRYLGVSLQDFRERVGWEWVVEAALRVAGYLRLPDAGADPLRHLKVEWHQVPAPIALPRAERDLVRKG